MKPELLDPEDNQNSERSLVRRFSVSSLNPESRVIIVSHRLPVVLDDFQSSEKKENDVVKNGGLCSAVNCLKAKGRKVIWVGYSGSNPTTDDEKEKIKEKFKEHDYVPVFLDPQLANAHFSGFCKGVIWPLFHYYDIEEITNFKYSEWQAFQKTNEIFADTVESIYQEGDIIFIQDYHLLVLPSFLRKKIPHSLIGFFLHIPWPTSELYRSLPVRTAILEGLLGADMIGFQTFAYVRHFLSACTRILGLPVNDRGVEVKGQLIRVEVAPIGIDPHSLLDVLKSNRVQEKIKEWKKSFQGKKIIVSRDRTEFIKGIPHKLRAFQAFLRDYPEWREDVILVQECIPSEESIGTERYKDLCEEIEQLVGSINGKYSTVKHTPIHYLQKSLSWEDSCALFSIADAGLITSLRDGMNLTSHEFTVCQAEKKSPLILSEFTGSAHCLSGAYLVNPWYEKKIARTIHEALTIGENERNSRHRYNYEYVMGHTSLDWAISFLKELQSPDQVQRVQTKKLDEKSFLFHLKLSTKRLLFLDYDGTLAPIRHHPEDAVPSKEVLSIIETLASNPNTKIYIVTGRSREFMNQFFGDMPVGLSCEHGNFFRLAGSKDWQNISNDLDLSWKESIKTILDDYTDRTPGSWVEVKEINLTWHYRGAEPVFGEHQKNDLILHLQGLPKLPVDILVGRKVVEIRPQGINKGYTIRKAIEQEDKGTDFIFCVGDDKTDEDMFEELGKLNIKYKYSATIGKKLTSAMYYLPSQLSVERLLKEMVEYDTVETD